MLKQQGNYTAGCDLPQNRAFVVLCAPVRHPVYTLPPQQGDHSQCRDSTHEQGGPRCSCVRQSPEWQGKDVEGKSPALRLRATWLAPLTCCEATAVTAEGTCRPQQNRLTLIYTLGLFAVNFGPVPVSFHVSSLASPQKWQTCSSVLIT